MSTIWEEIRYKVINSGSKLNLLIGINVAVFLVLFILSAISSSTHATILSWLTLPAYFLTLITRLWTVITYMFIHDGFFQLLFNMLWFYWIGQTFEEYLGGRKLLTLYFLGGVAGALLYLLAYNLIPSFEPIKQLASVTGATASVMSIIIGTATLLPDHSISLIFFGAVRLKWIALIFIVIDLLNIWGPNPGGVITHLGGAIIGFVYVKQLQNGNNIGNVFEKAFAPKSKLKVAYRNIPKGENRRPNPEEIDRILDKINKSGVKSLTKQEKELLSRASDDEKS